MLLRKLKRHPKNSLREGAAMIISVTELMENDMFDELSEEQLKAKLDALESMIRAYTNNNFQNRAVRFCGKSFSNMLYGYSPFIRIGDTVEISASEVNNGLYVVGSITPEYIEVDKELFEVPQNMVTKVEYPAAVRQGVLNLLTWELNNREKVGIKSETLSRHSVTYYDQDSANQIMGYPVSLMGFLKPYVKARF